MKTRIARILGVVLALSMLASPFVTPVPAAAAPGDTQWTSESLPSLGTNTVMKSGSNVTFAVADATTIYFADRTGAAGAQIYKSTNTGQGATAVTAYPGSAPKEIAVAPDNPSAVAVLEVGSTMQAVVTAAWSGNNTWFILNYTDQNGAASLSGNFNIPANSPVGTIVPVPLAAGDTSVVTVNAPIAGSGVIGAADALRIETSTPATTLATITGAATGIPVFTAGVVNQSSGVFVSNDGGTTWSNLPPLPAAYAGMTMNSIAVGPARGGTLLGREYLISVANPAGANVTNGDVLIVGNIATWATVGGAAGANLITSTFDFTKAIFTPNYLGDRCVAAVGNTAAASGTRAFVINTATNTVVQNTQLTVGTTTDFNSVAAGASIISSDIALPTDFDPTTTAGRRSYVCLTSYYAGVDTIPGTIDDAPQGDNDVYRIDDTSARALGAVTAQPVRSIAYAGTRETGTLFMGQNNAATVRRTTGMTTTSPTWTASDKSPFVRAAATAANFVRVAADFATSNRVFAVNFGAAATNSAFYISTDGGVSFNGELFHNSVAANNVVRINGVKLVPDGKTIFLATDDGTDLMLWKSATSVGATSWQRVLCVTAGTAGNRSLLEVNPSYGQVPAVFLTDAQAGGNIYVSTNGGATFANRMAPVGVNPAALTAQDDQVVYLGSGANVYKSSNGAWTWSTAIAHKATGAITSITVPRFDDVLIGGTAGAAYSIDGGTTFTAINTGLTGAGLIRIMDDTLYAGNKTIYAAGATNGTVFRYVIGTSAQWDSLNNPNTANGLIGIATPNSVLYVADNNAVANAGIVDRSLNAAPPVAIGQTEWTTMGGLAVAPSAAAFMTAVGTSTENYIYVSNATTSLWSYKDYLAVSKPEISAPADNYAVTIDPVSGRGDAVTISIKALGAGQGAVNTLELEIVEKAVGLQSFAPGTGAATYPTFSNIAINPGAPSFTYGAVGSGATCVGPFASGVEYTWRVRAQNTVSGDAIAGQWSKARTLKVQSGSVVQQPYAGPVIQGPTPGAMNVNPGLVGFAWAPVPGASEYTFILATDAALTKPIAGTPIKLMTTAFEATGLDNDTTYFWSVQATAPTVGPQAIATFHTAPKATAAPTVAPTSAPPVTPIINLPAPTTPPYIWAVIVIGAVLVVAVIILIVRTRRVP